MSNIYEVQTEAQYNGTAKTTVAGLAQSWDDTSALGGLAGDVKIVLPGGSTGAAYFGNSITALGASTQYLNMRMYVLPSGLTMSNGDQFNMMYCRRASPATFLFFLGLRRTDPGYSLVAYEYHDSGLFDNHVMAIPDTETYAEISVQKASTAMSGDGVFTARINGSIEYQNTSASIYTNLETVNQVLFGNIGGLDTTTSGDFFIGKILITDDANPIGPFRSYRHRPRPAAIMKKRQRIKGYRCG